MIFEFDANYAVNVVLNPDLKLTPFMGSVWFKHIKLYITVFCLEAALVRSSPN